MSFSTKVKDELIGIENEYSCCDVALAYGLLLFGRSFSLSDISMMTDYENTALKYKEVVEKVTGAFVTLTTTNSGKHILSVDLKSDREMIFKKMNLTGKEAFLRINRANLTNEGDDESNCCFSSFVRGAFLSSGMVCDPNKMYTLEFVISSTKLSEDFYSLLNEVGISSKITTRRGVKVLYIKDSSNIEDILTFMGATLSSIELMNVKIYKDVRNRINRKTNFETANISRTVDASVGQIELIELFEEKVGFEELEEDLKKIAILRTENPDMSLREIGECFSPPISRSSVNHKLQKLLSMAKQLQTENIQ